MGRKESDIYDAVAHTVATFQCNYGCLDYRGGSGPVGGYFDPWLRKIAK